MTAEQSGSAGASRFVYWTVATVVLGLTGPFQGVTLAASLQARLPPAVPRLPSESSQLLRADGRVDTPGQGLYPEQDIPHHTQQLIQRTRQVIDQLESPRDRLAHLLHLVDLVSRTSARQNEGTASPALLALLEDASRLVQYQSEDAHTDAWLAIADRYIALGQPQQATDTLTSALEATAAIALPLDRAQRLQHIAARRADLLEPSQAMAALLQAHELILQVPPSAAQAAALASLALQYADLGQPSQSAATLAQAQTQLTAVEPSQTGQRPGGSVPTPLAPQPWNGSVGLQGNLFSGESSRGVIALTADAERQWNRSALDLGLQLTYSIDDDEDDPDQFSARLATDAEYYFTENWQYFVDGSVVSDDLENLELRASLFSGVGITLLRSGDRELRLRTGVGLRYENFEEEGDDFNPPSLSLGLTYRDQVLNLVQVRQSLTLDAPVGDVSDYLFRSQTDLRIPISDRWSFDQGLRLTLSGESAPDNPGLLLNLQTGLRYQF